MARRFGNSFVVQWLILAMALSGFAGIFAHSFYLGHERVMAREGDRLHTQSRVISENLGKQLESTDKVLVLLRNEFSALPDKDSHLDCNDHLARLENALAGIRTLLILDENGIARFSNRPELVGRDFSYRDYFTRPRRNPDPARLFVSPPFKTVLGVWGISLTRVITDGKGAFAGVVSATLDPEYFSTLLASVRYAEDLRAVVIHGEGTVFRMIPEIPQVIGKNVAQPGAFFLRHRESGLAASLFHGTTYAAGERRLVAFRDIKPVGVPMDIPLVAVVSRDHDAVFETWNADARTYGSALALAVLLSCLALAGFQKYQRRQLKKIEQTDAALQDSEERFRALFHNSSDVILLHPLFGADGGVGKFVEVNAAASERLGYSRKELLAMTPLDLDEVGTYPSPADLAAFRQHALEVRHLVFERIHVAKDGRRIPVEVSAHVFELDGETMMLSIVRDITERKRAEEYQRIAATAFETREGIMITDSAGTILRVNHAFSKLTGYSAEEAIGKSPAMLQSGRQDSGFYRKLWETLLEEKYWEGEVWNRRKNGEVYPEWLTITAVVRPDGVVTHYVAVFSDITQRKAAEEQIHRLAFYDPLTNLPNRRLLLDRCGQALRSCIRHKDHGAILFLDLDRFKVLNDTRGHDVGDLLLIEVAHRLLSCVRAEDTVARMGGDEFIVVLEDLGPDAQGAVARAVGVAEKIRVALDAPYALDGYSHQSSPSIDVCVFDGTEASVNELLMHADQAMYQAKAAGRNTVCVFEEEAAAAS